MEQPGKRINLAFKLSDELKHIIFRDWGIFHHKHQHWHRAIKAYHDSIELDEHDYIPLEKCSKCHYQICEIEQAITEILAAIAVNSTRPISQLKLYHHLIDCLLEQNNFEKCLIKTYQTIRLNDKHVNNSNCQARLEYLQSIINQSIGHDAGSCLFKARRAIHKVELKNAIRPPSKRNICGTLSAVNLGDKHNPMIEHRNALNQSLLNSTYLGHSGIDLVFLSKLSKCDTLFLKQTPESTKKLDKQVNDAVTSLFRWREMLQNREPMYTKNHTSEQYKEAFLYRVQYQTRRDIFKQLEDVRALMLAGDVDGIVKNVQNILHHYYSIKTIRVFPRKFEFCNDLCNMVGITYLHNLVIPVDLMTCPPFDRIMHLFSLKTLSETEEEYFEEHEELKPLDFGNIIDSVNPDKTFIITKHKLEGWLALIQLVKYPIEQCLVFFEMAQLDLVLQKVDEAMIQAKRVIMNATSCQNSIWLYLGYLIIVRSDQMRRAYTNVQDTLIKMTTIAENLDVHVQHYTSVATELNRLDIERRATEERLRVEEKLEEEKLRKLKEEWLLRQSTTFPRTSGTGKYGSSEAATRASEISRLLALQLAALD